MKRQIYEDFKKREEKKLGSRRRKLWNFRTFTIQQTCIEAGIARQYNWSEEVLGQISSINDLVAEKGAHHDCHIRFYKLEKYTN